MCDDNFELVEGKKLVYVTEEDPNEKVTKYYYDEFDELVRVVDASSKFIEFEYEKGKLKTIIDANLNTTTYDYDKVNRLEPVSEHDCGSVEKHVHSDCKQGENACRDRYRSELSLCLAQRIDEQS